MFAEVCSTGNFLRLSVRLSEAGGKAHGAPPLRDWNTLAANQSDDLLIAASPAAAATAASTTVTAAISAPPAAVAASAASVLGFRTRLIHVERTATHLRTVQRRNGLVTVLVAGHFDKTESARPAGIPVCHDADPVYLSERFKHLSQFVF
jgi:hypothetical protein